LDTEKIQAFIERGAEASPLLSEILEDLSSRGLGDFVEIDLRIVRGLAYYTGSVFEIFDIGKGMRAVAGGGRYDQLVDLIGGVDLPACGFAMGDMVISDFIRETENPNEKLEKALHSHRAIDVFVVIADETMRKESNALIQDLRSTGYAVSQPLSPMKVGKQFQVAEHAGAGVAVVIGSEFPDVTIKDLGQREESICRADELIEKLARLR